MNGRSAADDPHPPVSLPAAVVEEPPRPDRIRRPYDLLRFFGWVLFTGGLLLLGTVAFRTTSGIESDLTDAITTLPDLILSALAYGSELLLLALPLVLIADLAVRRRWRTLFVASVAGVAAWLLAAAFVTWGPDLVSDTLLDALTYQTGRSTRTAVAFPTVSGIAAFATVSGLLGRSRLQILVWGTVAGYAVLLMFDRSATGLALAVSAAMGRTLGVGTRYVFGTVNPRPNGARIATALARVAEPLAYLRLIDETDDGRRYHARTLDGRLLDVLVIDRDRRAAGALYQLWRRIRVQRSVERWSTLSLRNAVDQSVLPVMAATAAGVRTPAVVAAAAVDRDASVIAFEHIEGLRTFDELDPDELTDALLADLWHQVRLLHRAGIAHEALSADNLAVDPENRPWLLGTRAGEIAADHLTLRIDDAELLVSTALIIGPRRAVDAALGELTAQRVGEALPLIQPIALSRVTRARLKKQRGLLGELREAVVGASPSAPTDPVRLERLRPRIVVSLIALGFAVSILLGQLANVDLTTLVSSADRTWVLVALGMSFVTYLGATLVITSFSPITLKPVRTFLTQLASTFVSLVAPAAVGNVGTNTRYIQQAGATPSLALASVGTSQAFVFLSYLILIVVFGFFTSTQQGPDLVPGRTMILVLVTILAVVALTVGVPYTRRLIGRRVRPMLDRTLPRLIAMLRQPRRVALGLLGAMTLNLAYAAALTAAVYAYGGSLAYPTVGFVYLAAGAIGSAAPTPGGIGAVEAALAAGLTAAGLDGTTAVQAALLFRAATFWLPVVPGWLSFQWLQRRGAL
ncbi:MAG: flippase-like domain-containing protein [Actinomycetota bacterium]|nr:flippase-like domain-containing protein [Actinomycetota bacterium]